jgi:hypothetical protein
MILKNKIELICPNDRNKLTSKKTFLHAIYVNLISKLLTIPFIYFRQEKIKLSLHKNHMIIGMVEFQEHLNTDIKKMI